MSRQKVTPDNKLKGEILFYICNDFPLEKEFKYKYEHEILKIIVVVELPLSYLSKSYFKIPGFISSIPNNLKWFSDFLTF